MREGVLLRATMLNLSKNCSFKFLKDDAKIYALCRKLKHNPTLIADEAIMKNLVLNPLRYSFYSEPVVDRKGVVKNKMILFGNEELCHSWWIKNNVNNKASSEDDTRSTLDGPIYDSFGPDVSNISFTLQDIKAVSEDMRMSLLVIIDAKEVENASHYEIFFYDAKNKQLNF